MAGLLSDANDPGFLAKLGLLFSDPFGSRVPFAGGAMSPGSDLNRFGLLFTDPFGESVPFPGARGAKGPSTNAADYEPLADAFGSEPPKPIASPPVASPPVINSPPPQALDQRAYGVPGQGGPLQPPTVITPQNTQTQTVDVPQQEPNRLGAGFGSFVGNLHNGPIAAILGGIGGAVSGKRNDPYGVSLEKQQTTMRAVAQSLMSRGYPADQAIGMAQAAAIDPKVAEKILGDAYASPKTMEEVIARNTANRQRGSASSPMADYEEFLRTKNRGEKAGTTEGERVANAQLDLPSAVAQANEQLRLVGDLRSHPGRGQIGWHDVLGGAPLLPSTKGYDAQRLLDQIKGGAFLEAFKSLKGGGQITEVEGKKATDAIARMDRATSRAEFDKALSDYEGVIKLGVDRANQLAGRPAPGGFQGNSGWQQVSPGVRIRQVQQ